MKTEQILNLDYRKKENKEIIQKVLRKIKPLSKYSDEVDVPIEAIEKLIHVLVQKYEILPQWMNMTYFEPIISIYSISIKTTTDHILFCLFFYKSLPLFSYKHGFPKR